MSWKFEEDQTVFVLDVLSGRYDKGIIHKQQGISECPFYKIYFPDPDIVDDVSEEDIFKDEVVAIKKTIESINQKILVWEGRKRELKMKLEK